MRYIDGMYVRVKVRAEVRRSLRVRVRVTRG